MTGGCLGERRKDGKTSQFWDDQGAWEKGSTNKTTFVKYNYGTTKKVVKQGKYCLERRKDKQTMYIPLEPQPNSNQILILHRFYVKHTCDEYHKRVSWLGTQETRRLATYEYKGVCPPPKPHGKVKTSNPGATSPKSHATDEKRPAAHKNERSIPV